MKCVIIDDEPLAQEVIEKLASKIPFLEVLKKAGNAIEGLQAIESLRPDLVFMDIQMPTMSGIELIRILSDYRPHIILTTASPDYALEGFELEVAGYLLKPISFERFLKAVNKVQHLVNGSARNAAQADASQRIDTHFWAKVNGRYLHVRFEDVLLVKGMKDYVQIFLKDRRFITYLTMKRMQEILPPGDFTRVSRSYIVRTSCIRGMDGNMLETAIEGEEITIGPTYRESIMREAGRWLK